MSLLDLTIRNVQRNFRLYSIYLFSMIAGVIIHYTFSSLMYNGDILEALKNRQNFQSGVIIASIVVFLFIAFFILYANSFFMRQRKKEFGMYLLLGLKERQITLMVFYEILFIGAIALVAGILLGGLLSKLFGMLLMNLMQYDQAISLSFPLQAILSTIGLFFLLAVVISVHSHIMIRRVQLVELFHAKEKMEKPIRSSSIVAILSIVLLVSAFVIISGGRESVMWQDYTTVSMIIVTIGIIGGTYLFFRQFTGWLLQVISRRRKYHEGNTVLWTSSLRFQVRGNTLNLTFISLFSAVIILLTCFVAINYNVQFQAVGRNIPNDIAFSSMSLGNNKQVDRLIKQSGHELEEHRRVEALVVKPLSDLTEAFENPEYYESNLLLVSENTYNEVVTSRNGDQHVDLRDNEVVSLAQGSDLMRVYESGDQPSLTVEAGSNVEVMFRLAEKKDYALLGWSTTPEASMSIKPAMLVISDEKYEELQQQATQQGYELYQIQDANNAEALSKSVYEMVTRLAPNTYYSSFADVYSVQIEGSSLMLFAGGFLALIAIFALASVIYFKQLREATEEQQQFAILGKLGVDSRLLRSAIRKKLLFVFSPPLLLGVMHSWMIINYYILDSIQDFPDLDNLVWGIMIVYFFIYFLFYLSSANLYHKIVHQKR